MVSGHTAHPSSAKCVLRGGMLNTTHLLTAGVVWRCVPTLVKHGFQPVYGTVRRCTHMDVRRRVYVRQCTSKYGTLSRRTSTQDTVDANYMLPNVVVSGRNCIAVQHRTTTQCELCCSNQSAWLQHCRTL